ncbi:RNase H domain-containing protein [Trichonephila clavipes]|nr:RNase H domain-containing protein [Trichonephila clavipes]
MPGYNSNLKTASEKRPPKNQSNTIKPKIEIKTAPHRPRKPAPTEYSTDEEDMIVYDVDDEPELNPKCVISYKGEIVKGRNGASIRGSAIGYEARHHTHHIFKIWQESWSQQLDNKLHSVKPVLEAWSVMPMRRTDVKLTRLRIGHTRFTHRHLLLSEDAPECPSCKVSYTVRHILIDCPAFNNSRIIFFNSSHLTLPDLVGEIAHHNLFAFIRRLGFLYLI